MQCALVEAASCLPLRNWVVRVTEERTTENSGGIQWPYGNALIPEDCLEKQSFQGEPLNGCAHSENESRSHS